MVEGSTRKIYKQKGTGRARHGNIRAPIFVGGGIVFGPSPRDYSLLMPTRMRRKALASAFSSQYTAGNIIIVDGLKTLKPKTKSMAHALDAIVSERPILLIISKDAGDVVRITRNIASVDTTPAQFVTTYDVISHKKVLCMKDAVTEIKETIIKEL
jgi:large subunit ribosomal protein L4